MKFANCHQDRRYYAKGLCKPCYDKVFIARKRQNPTWLANHNQKQNASARKRRQDPITLEKQRAYDAEWKKENRKRGSAYAERQKEVAKAWHKAHPDYEKERSKRRRTENPGPLNEAVKRYRQRNPEKVRQFKKNWQAKNREKYLIQMRMYVKRRKARKKGAIVCDFIAVQWEQMKLEYSFKCFYCNIQPEFLTQDHMIPLSRGGEHTAANIVPACVSCNSKKGTMTTEEYINALAAA